MQGEEEEDLALLRGPTTAVGRFWMRTSASLPFSPRPAGRTRKSHPRGRRSGPTDLGRLRSGSRGRVPPHPSRPEPRGEGGLQLAGRAVPRIVRARPADPVCDRPSVSLAVFLEDAPIGVSSSPAAPPALVFVDGEGTPVTGRVADPQVSVVAPRHQPPLRLGERRSRRPARPRRRAGLAEGGHPHRSACARTTGSAELPTTSTSISSTSSTASARRTRPTKAKWRTRRPAPSWPVGDETKGCLPTPQLASGDTLIRDTDD